MSGAKKGRKSYKRVPKKVRAAVTPVVEQAPQAPAQPALPDMSAGSDYMANPNQQPTG